MFLSNATPHSQRLFSLAATIAPLCPLSVDDEATVTGSVSRGVADSLSDIELNFWVGQLQPVEVYRDWASSLGVQGDPSLLIWRQSADICQIKVTISGVNYDFIWQTWHSLDQALAPLDDRQLPADPTLPWMLFHAIPLGSATRFATYQDRVAIYPEALRQNIIHQHVATWRRMLHVPHIFFASAQVERGQIHDLRRRQLMGVDSILKVLFAYNRLWQPDFKWIAEESQRLNFQPPQLVERINALLSVADREATVFSMARLFDDTLQILADEFDVADMLEQLRNS